MNLMCYYFLFNWTPTLLSSANMPLAKAALYTSVIQVGGVIGGWTIGYLIDKFGYTPVAVLPFVGIIVVGAIGYLVFFSGTLLTVAMFLAGFSVLGFNYATNAVAGMMYPTAFRSNATGWCFAIGRAGSVTGPVLGGLLVSMNMSVQHLYVCAAVPYVIAAPVGVYFIRLYRQRYMGERPGAAAQAAAQAAGGK
jgi:AAHS family 4-hydroxybenzoate transporter-like MFS transporter